MAEYSTQISQTPQVSYLTSDHLGSPRVVTNGSGSVVSRKDFTAFGEETVTPQRISALGYNPQNIRQDYAGYQKDDESGLEFAQARYYNAGHGRFTSADPLTASASIRDPQTFNRYSYALNSPYRFTDPLGLISSSTGACGQCGKEEFGGGGGGGGNPFNARDTSYDWALFSVTIDLNIVYDPTQYTREQAIEATRRSLSDLRNTYAKLGISFNVTYSEGTFDSSQLDQYGLPTRIASGAKENAVNAFLFVDNSAATKGRNGSSYNPQSQQIFLWEGSSDANPRSSNVYYRLSSGALAHEFGHLFLQYAGFPMTRTFWNNAGQDAGITFALNQIRYNPFFEPDPELSDDFDYKRDVGKNNMIGPYGVPQTRRKTSAQPTFEQLLRIGAKRVSNHLNK